MGSFETRDDASNLALRTLHVPVLKGDIWSAAKEMVDDLPGWAVVSVDDEAMVAVCRRDRGMLGGVATITITVGGPEGIPSASVHLKSETEGGFLSKDKANVAEFLRPFHRRVC